MAKKQIRIAIITILLVPFLRTVPALALGDKVVPHVVDGSQGPGDVAYRTKFAITNLSPFTNTTLTRVTVLFFNNDGTPWILATDQGTGSSIQLNLGYSQTIRISTLGTGSARSGYAIIRNLEIPPTNPSDPLYGNDQFADNREVAVTVFYEVFLDNDLIDTVNVPVAPPTVKWIFPVEFDATRGTKTGFAIVNLSDTSNQVTLYLNVTQNPLSGNAGDGGSTIVTLDNGVNKKKVVFLDELAFPSSLTNFKGMAYGTSDHPVAILALLQTQATRSGGINNGVQFATLAPAYLDAMRTNTTMFLPQGYSLDADIPVVDYFRTESSTADAYYETPWDLLYETIGTAGTSRQLTPQQGASFAVIGMISDPNQFDYSINIEYLRGLTYTTNSIDLSNGNPNLAANFTFAIKTALGRYVKVRVRDLILRDPDTTKDLTLEVYVYK